MNKYRFFQANKFKTILLAASVFSSSSFAEFQSSEVIKKVSPKYPREAYLRQIEGYVSVIFVVNKKGEAEDIEVIDEKPKRIFRKSALNALKKWKFKPAMDDGKRTTDIMEITIDFNMH
ncbi:energy transducer TonB [Psychrosphaera sp. B3R10]|uniref:energy transducer TonB n=1 Tax=unclassified Psychrosphaera TaxID=2641570 RepID=UPI001C084154|nr:energy transducer TonB [Psychrosphaera sp. 1_MG-2023]MBU2881051.1 energy transducer TonB [Psychrosphaera sp. I2R16]MBU2989975.1 energy transducer TonB [Psychrosphaera sp. B3R10]MDO6719133.1 energy transducer TonB [Psychrosphaera sp. 1_MG-2023]